MRAVLVVDRHETPREVHVLSPARETVLGGSAEEIDIGTSGPVARVIPSGDGTWQIAVGDATPEPLHHGQPLKLSQCNARFLLADDVTRALDEDRYLATILDPLTQTIARPFLASHLHRLAPPIALLMIDLDRFKQLNDTYGFEYGDRTLATVAARIQAQLRWPELVARIGGEEFLAILPGAPLDRATARAEAIRTAIEAPIALEDETLAVTISIGIALAGAGEPAFAVALRTAEHHLDLAKMRGRNRVVASDP